MSLESVRAFFAEKAPDIAIIELETSTATVALAAEAHGVEPGRIAKTLSLRVGERTVLVVARGDARLDNRKLKEAFGGKAKMLGAEEVVELTGHPVGGVCPFGLATPLPVYCDVSLQAFDEVLPAAGAVHSAVRIGPQRMAELVAADWIDVCQERLINQFRFAAHRGRSPLLHPMETSVSSGLHPRWASGRSNPPRYIPAPPLLPQQHSPNTLLFAQRLNCLPETTNH